jgi:nitrite reductase/ring-hydroxylating ferredoxin subunit/multimeric flavodoxin WrbA
MATADWVDVGAAADLAGKPVREVKARSVLVALTWSDGTFGAIHGACNHVGGPLGQGTLQEGFLVCPWHGWKFHAKTGMGQPGFEEDCVPAFPVKVEDGRVLVDVANATRRRKKPHPPHPLARRIERAPGPVRVAGISTTNMSRHVPRYSTSEALLEEALRHAQGALGAETQVLRLREISFKACEGYYSKSAHACTWPCTITQFDPKDQLDRVYEAVVHWADVLLVATPIRWGSASSLYYRMVERMNCVQNQQTIADRVLIEDKVAAFVITGGQDGVQSVAGQMLGFFSELGFHFPQFPYIAHSRGWSAEDMENNVRYVQESEDLREGARALAARAVEMSKTLLAGALGERDQAPGGRKAHQLDVKAQT